MEGTPSTLRRVPSFALGFDLQSNLTFLHAALEILSYSMANKILRVGDHFVPFEKEIWKHP